MTKRTILHFLDAILAGIESIQEFVAGMKFEEFEKDNKTIRAVEREFEIIGEAVKKIPNSLILEYPEISWKAIAGMRDHLSHHYWSTEVEILWKTIFGPLPQLNIAIKKIIESEKR